jgi:hypothetical protein
MTPTELSDHRDLPALYRKSGMHDAAAAVERLLAEIGRLRAAEQAAAAREREEEREAMGENAVIDTVCAVCKKNTATVNPYVYCGWFLIGLCSSCAGRVK